MEKRVGRLMTWKQKKSSLVGMWFFYETVFPFPSHKNGQSEADRLIGDVRSLDDTCLHDWCVFEDPNGSTKIIKPIEHMELPTVSRKVEFTKDFA